MTTAGKIATLTGACALSAVWPTMLVLHGCTMNVPPSQPATVPAVVVESGAISVMPPASTQPAIGFTIVVQPGAFQAQLGPTESNVTSKTIIYAATAIGSGLVLLAAAWVIAAIVKRRSN